MKGNTLYFVAARILPLVPGSNQSMGDKRVFWLDLFIAQDNEQFLLRMSAFQMHQKLKMDCFRA